MTSANRFILIRELGQPQCTSAKQDRHRHTSRDEPNKVDQRMKNAGHQARNDCHGRDQLPDRLWFLRPLIPVMQWIGKAPYVSFMSANDMLREVASAGFAEQEHWTHGRANSLFLVASKTE